MKFKKLIIIALILFAAVHFFGCDISGAVSAAKTFVIDTVDKVIPGSREQFENIDAQISGAVVRSGASATLDDASSKAIKSAENLFNKAAASAKKAASKAGINFDTKPQKSSPKDSGNNSAKNSGVKLSGNSNEKSVKKVYVSSANLNPKKLSELRLRLIIYGMSLRGIPYKLGSENPANGLDCSGFVRYAAKNGINVQLPRTAREMYAAVEKIPASEREPGDLVFFRSFGKVDHVGIYLGTYKGEGRLHGRKIFLNSASAGPRTGVVVSALDEPYWRRHYSSTGRFLPSYKQVARAE